MSFGTISLTPRTSASSPVPMMPTVNSRPGRKVSASTGWAKRASRSAATARKAAASPTLERSPTPLPEPSATGLRNRGYGKATFAASSMRSMTAKSAVGTPASRTTRLAIPLSSVRARVRGSENT